MPTGFWTTLGQLRERAGELEQRLRRPATTPAPAPAAPPGLHRLPARELATITRVGVPTTDEWGEEFTLYGGTRMSVQVGTNPVLVQIGSETPPQRPQWLAEPIYLPLGPWGHAGAFGYFRFRSANTGRPGLVSFTAYSDPPSS